MMAVEFLSRLQLIPESGCLEFTGARRKFGHGNLRYDGHTVYAHRLAWELANGPIPDGLCVCHECDNPPCCNPEHLFLGTRRDNNNDRTAKGRHAQGERMHTARLTVVQVRRIRAELGAGIPASVLARRYGVVPSTISDVKLGKTWQSAAAGAA